MPNWTVENPAVMDTVAKDILALAQEQKTEAATVITLTGDLGAGKTTLTQAIARTLSITETVTSPTFVVMKRYDTSGVWQSLVHIDAYRIENVDEMRVLGLADLLQEKDTIICIEWPERIASMIPDHALRLNLEIADEGRVVTLA